MLDLTHHNEKKWGVGSLAPCIACLSILFSFTDISGKFVGEYILGYFKISLPLDMISFLLFSISIYIGSTNKEDYGAHFGKSLSVVFVTIMVILTIVYKLLSLSLWSVR